MLSQALRSALQRRRQAAPFSSAARSSMGIVDRVLGQSAAVVKGLEASPNSLLVFQSGACGLAVDLKKGDSVSAALLYGSTRPKETVAMEKPLLHFDCSFGYLGRVVDPLGQPLDGKGPISGAAAVPSSLETSEGTGNAWQLPLFRSDIAGPADRAPARMALSTGFKAIDAFNPLARGSSMMLLGEQGCGKSKLALDMAINVARAGKSGCEAAGAQGGVSGSSSSWAHASPVTAEQQPTYVVLALLGMSNNQISESISKLRLAGVLDRVCVIAAPSGSHPGLQYLAPFAAAALGEFFMLQGRHSLVLYDDLSAHYTAARQVSAADWAKSGAVPSMHGLLLDRAAQLSEGRGGGSMTVLGLLESVPDGPSFTRIEHIKAREQVASTASLADRRVKLSSSARKDSALLPLSFEELLHSTGHAVQGEALRHYSERMRCLLTELRETARGVLLAESHGIEVEAEKDELIDLHAKARLLLLPTATGLQQASLQNLAVEDVRRLSLSGLKYASTGAAGSAEAAAGALEAGAASGGAGAVPAIAGASSAAGLSLSASAASKSLQKAAAAASASSAAARAEDDGEEGKENPSLSADARRAALLSKLDSSQKEALAAVEARRAARSSLASKAASIGFGSGTASAAIASSAAGAVGGGGGRQAAAAAAAAEADKEGGSSSSSSHIPFRPPTGRTAPAPVFAEAAGRPLLVENLHTAAAAAGILSPFPIWEGVADSSSSSPSSSSPSAASSLSLLSDMQQQRQLEQRHAPHLAHPARTLLTLFLLSHTYVHRVPLQRLQEYEQQLYQHLCSLAPPQDVTKAGARDKRAEAEREAQLEEKESEKGEESVSIAEQGRHGFFAPSVSTRWVTTAAAADTASDTASPLYREPCLLDAALSAPVPSWMVESSDINPSLSMRTATLQLAQQAASAAILASAADGSSSSSSSSSNMNPVYASLPQAQKDMQRKLSFSFSFHSAERKRKEKEEQEAVLRALEERHQQEHRLRMQAQLEADPVYRIGRYVRLDSGGSLEKLPPVWSALHLAVADFTRRFCGEPQ